MLTRYCTHAKQQHNITCIVSLSDCSEPEVTPISTLDFIYIYDDLIGTTLQDSAAMKMESHTVLEWSLVKMYPHSLAHVINHSYKNNLGNIPLIHCK